jgi:hypothetical protein
MVGMRTGDRFEAGSWGVVKGTEQCVTARYAREHLKREGLIPLHLAVSFGMMIRRGRTVEINDLLVQRVIELELGVGRMSPSVPLRVKIMKFEFQLSDFLQ